MLRKDFGLEIKNVDETGVIEGYGSTFGGEPDSYGDIVLPGAFAPSLASHIKAGTMPLMLWGHNAHDLPIGDWQDMAEDSKGLWVKGQIDLDDPVGQRVYKALKRKSVRGLSIGYDVAERRTDPKKPGIMFLEKLNLHEVSVVNFPANRNSLLASVKTIREGGLPSLPEFEKFLREAGGFSKSEAAAIAGNGLAHLYRSESGGDPEPNGEDFLAAMLAALKA